MSNDREVACPNCYQMNHYNATRCQHCLGDTWRSINEPGDTEYSNFTMWFWIIAVGIGAGMMFGIVVAAVWFAFWVGLAILDGIGFGKLLLLGIVGFILAVLFL